MTALDKLELILVDVLGIKPEEIKTTTTLQDLGADSLDAVEVEMEVEQQFGVELDDNAVTIETTIARLLALVEPN